MYKAKPDTENIRDLNLAVVRRMTVQVIKLVLQSELLLIGHNQLYQASTKRGLLTTTPNLHLYMLEYLKVVY
jgi:hypothetical protein